MTRIGTNIKIHRNTLLGTKTISYSKTSALSERQQHYRVTISDSLRTFISHCCQGKIQCHISPVLSSFNFISCGCQTYPFHTGFKIPCWEITLIWLKWKKGNCYTFELLAVIILEIKKKTPVLRDTGCLDRISVCHKRYPWCWSYCGLSGGISTMDSACDIYIVKICFGRSHYFGQ